MSDTITAYDVEANALAVRYESVSAEVVHAALLEFIPRGRDLLALDVGAGSGRDAAWLASLGYEVVAAEPAAGMRREASKRRLRLRQDQQVPEWAGLRSIEEPSTRVIPEPLGVSCQITSQH